MASETATFKTVITYKERTELRKFSQHSTVERCSLCRMAMISQLNAGLAMTCHPQYRVQHIIGKPYYLGVQDDDGRHEQVDDFIKAHCKPYEVVIWESMVGSLYCDRKHLTMFYGYIVESNKLRHVAVRIDSDGNIEALDATNVTIYIKDYSDCYHFSMLHRDSTAVIRKDFLSLARRVELLFSIEKDQYNNYKPPYCYSATRESYNRRMYEYIAGFLLATNDMRMFSSKSLTSLGELCQKVYENLWVGNEKAFQIVPSSLFSSMEKSSIDNFCQRRYPTLVDSPQTRYWDRIVTEMLQNNESEKAELISEAQYLGYLYLDIGCVLRKRYGKIFTEECACDYVLEKRHRKIFRRVLKKVKSSNHYYQCAFLLRQARDSCFCCCCCYDMVQ